MNTVVDYEVLEHVVQYSAELCLERGLLSLRHGCRCKLLHGFRILSFKITVYFISCSDSEENDSSKKNKMFEYLSQYNDTSIPQNVKVNDLKIRIK